MICLDPVKRYLYFEEDKRSSSLEQLILPSVHDAWARAFVDSDDHASTGALAEEGDVFDEEEPHEFFEHNELSIPYTMNCFEYGLYYENLVSDGVFSRPKIVSIIPDLWIQNYKFNITSAYQISSRFSEPIVQSFAVPKDLGLIYLAARYKAKYDIDIFVAGDARSIARIIQEALALKKAQIFGIICSYKEFDICHVTPILCLIKESFELQIVNLDSTKTPLESFGHALGYLKKEKIVYQRFSLKGVRQADCYSCRTDALTILKDALRDLKHHAVNDLSTYFTGLEGCDRRLYVDLPMPWSRVCQTSRLQNGSSEQLLIGKKGLTVKSFKEKFTFNCVRSDAFELLGFDQEGRKKAQIIEISTDVKVNLFLIYKGKKNFENLKSFITNLQKKDIDWIQYLESKY
jgi:hypothetical protein